MKHTPGPWTVFNDNRYIVANGKRTLIATVHKDMEGFAMGLRRSERDANARLLAETPNLVRALVDIRDSSAYCLASKARAAMALEAIDDNLEVHHT